MHAKATNVKNEPFRVLDLGGNGEFCKRYNSRNPIYSVLPLLEGRRIEIVAINNKMHGDLRKPSANCTIEQKPGRAPADLAGEPDGYYDHVHMHMMTASFQANDLRRTLLEIDRVLKPEGIFFASSDSTFVCRDDGFFRQSKDEPSWRQLDEAKIAKYVLGTMFSYFIPLYCDLRVILARGSKIKNMASSSLKGVAGFFECEFYKAENLGAPSWADDVQSLFEQFSHCADYADYYAIMEKSMAKPKTKKIHA